MTLTRVSHYNRFSELPENFTALLDIMETGNLFSDRDWFQFLMTEMFTDDVEMRIYTVEDENTGQPLLIAPMRYTLADGAVSYAHTLASISHVENFTLACLTFEPTVDNHAGILTALFLYLKACSEDDLPTAFDAIRLWPFEVKSELIDTVYTALRHAGFWVQPYTNSYNRYEDTSEKSYDDYFASRGSKMRYNVRSRQRGLEKNGTLEFDLYLNEENLKQGIKDYTTVTMASWKNPPSMIARDLINLMRLAARKNYLRLGILKHNGQPVAAQFWIVTGGVGHSVRIAYDEAFKKQAVGTILTNFMIKHMLDQDHVKAIDYGYGGEEFKGDWMRDERYYLGYIAFNPATKRGLYFGIKHIAGRPFKRAIKWLIHIPNKLKRKR